MVRAGFILAVLSAGLLSGCAQTIDNDEMVGLYLAQAPRWQSEFGWYANYNGLHAGYHHLKIDYSNYGNLFAMTFKGAFTTKEYRCKAETLPSGFPDDLSESLQQCRGAVRSGNHRQVVEEAVSKYLQPIRTRDK